MNLFKPAFIGVAAAALAITACTSGKPVEETVSGLNPARFDSIVNNKKTALFTLKNSNGMEVCITNFGGRVVSLVVPDVNGKPTDETVYRLREQPERLRFVCRTLRQPHRRRQAHGCWQDIPAASEQFRTLSPRRSFRLDVSGLRCQAT